MKKSTFLRNPAMRLPVRPSFPKNNWLKRVLALGAVAIAFQWMNADAIVGGPWKDEDSAMALEKAKHAERAKGNLAEAEMLYRQVIADPDASPELVVRAKLMLAECLVRKGGGAAVTGAVVAAAEKPKPDVVGELDGDLVAHKSLLAQFESIVKKVKDPTLSEALRKAYQTKAEEMAAEIEKLDKRTAKKRLAAKPLPFGPAPKPDDRVDIDSTLDMLVKKSQVPVDRKMLNEAVFEGIASVLGEHADYFDPAELARFQTTVNSRLIGIGAMLGWDKETDSRDELMIVKLIGGGAAKKANVQVGDKIVAIDGKPLSAIGTELHEMVDVIRGEEGSEVVLTMVKVGSKEREEVRLIRTRVALGETRMITDAFETEEGESQFMIDEESGIGAVRLRMFSTGIADALRKRLKEMKDGGMRGLVIDLRGNGGGSLSEGIDVASLFLGSLPVVTTKTPDGKSLDYEGRLKFAPYGGMPIVVLVDEQTASAAEILAAALQDHDLAVVIGRRTFGKGTVETVIPLGEAGALKFSISEFYRPSGKPMKRPENDATAAEDPNWGVHPDEGFEIAAKKFPRDLTAKQRFEQDPVWQKAIETLKEKIGE